MFKILIFHCLYLTSSINASDRPIIGVLSQEAYLVRHAYPEADSFIAASYVKMLEASGARVIPIWIGQDKAYYDRIVNYTNGVVFPGGGVYFNQTGGYGEAASHIYAAALEINTNGVNYPLWGICLGLQVLMFAAAGRDIRSDCSALDEAIPLNFEPAYKDSRLYAGMPAELLAALEADNVTYNYHRYCIFRADLAQRGLLADWTVLSHNSDKLGAEFVSSMEHKRFPFVGMQFHPEKPPYEFKKGTAVPHSPEAVRIAQYFGNLFVGEARQNNHAFPDASVEDKLLIYNYTATFSQAKTGYEQLYLFTANDYQSGGLL